MTKYRIIGNMTGNSMDAIDLVLTEFDGNNMTDICYFSQPYTQNMQQDMEYLRASAREKTRSEFATIDDFNIIHDRYIHQIATCINQMLTQNNIDKSTINAIGFHGKTLDHNPPSVAALTNTLPYTLQIGSGQMLADLTGIPVIYDFRSDFIMNGFDGAPLIPPHNAHIALTEGDGCYYNGGNTANFALICNGQEIISADAGPFNEYIDNFIRCYTDESYDKNGMYGLQGQLDTVLLQKLYDIGRKYYELPLPKSGDPQYYHRDIVFNEIIKEYGDISSQSTNFTTIIYTLEYFAAYIAVQALTLIPQKQESLEQIILFGGGWKNPVIRQTFDTLLNGKGYILPEHQQQFADLIQHFKISPKIRYSSFGEFMEARLMADLAYYHLQHKAWPISNNQHIICGRMAVPTPKRNTYFDKINQAYYGWQCRK